VIPAKLFEQLVDGGILLAPVLKGNKQIITRYTKNANSIDKEELEECDFVPILDGIEK
jgi:protein-L-isoaspartate(D-aspartate) O-methyltransferase